jgi:hypothetical protein
LIAGITYVPGYVDPDTHARLLSAVDEHPWLVSVDHGVQVYGYSYNHTLRAAYRVGALPAWATALAQRLYRDGYVERVPNQLVANAYEPGTGMFDHVDQAVFGEVVMPVTLGSTCTIRFTRADTDAVHCQHEGALLLEPRSLLVLSGGVGTGSRNRARFRCGMAVCMCRGRRVSLTFRAVPDES